MLRAALTCSLIAVLGCRDRTTETEPIDEPVAPSALPTPLGPGTLEMTVAACAIAPDARVWCWDLFDETPGWLKDADHVAQIWLVDDTLCLREEDQVRCIQPEDTLDPPLPGDAEGRMTSPSGRAVIDLGFSDDHQCLIDDEGAAWCRWLPWEDGVEMPSLERYPIGQVREIEIADEIGCMILIDGSAHCYFGSGLDGLDQHYGAALGTTVGQYCTRSPSALHCDAPIGGRADWPLAFRILERAHDMAIGPDYACLIDENGAVGCVNPSPIGGVLSVGATDDFAAVAGLPPMIEIDGSDDHVCGRSDDGEVWCWGSNEFGQLGDGTTSSHAEPRPVKAGQWPGLQQISVGFAKSCAVTREGMECWGWLENNRRFDAAPSEIPGVRASALASREYTTCAREAKSWKCWGGETRGLEGTTGAARILEVASYVDSPAEGCVLENHQLRCVDDDGKSTLDMSDVVAVAPGRADICVLVDRRVICVIPSLPGLGRAEFEVPASTAISGGEWHGCVLDGRGKPHCWNDQDHRLQAIALGAKLVTVVATTIGDCGLDRAGKVHCWGEWTPDAKPFVLELAKIIELVGGADQLCARDHEGGVWCWGRSVEADRAVDPRKPTKMTVPAAQQLVAGFDHVCSLATDGRVSCWGSEVESQRARLSPELALRPEPFDFFGP